MCGVELFQDVWCVCEKGVVLFKDVKHFEKWEMGMYMVVL